MQSTLFDRRAHPPGASFSTWRARDGWPIRRLDWPQPERSGARGSILFGGGRGDFIEKYLEPLAHWHGRRWNVTSFDWRSQGESRGDIEGGHLDSFDPLLADGSELLKEWMDRTAGPHVAVGHSMGGHLLLRILADQRPPLASAILVAPMIGINTSPIPTAASQATAQTFCALGWNRLPAWRQSLKPAPFGSTRQSFLTACADRYSDELWWLERHPEFALGAPSWGWLNAAYRSMAAVTEEKLRNMETPVLLLGAERDRLVSASAIRWAAGLLPNAELVIYPDAAHEILREAEPLRSEVMARIDDFLEDHTGE